MKVTALKNLIYDAVFYKAGCSVDMDDSAIFRYKSHGLIVVEVTDKPERILSELPPLDAPRKKK